MKDASLASFEGQLVAESESAEALPTEDIPFRVLLLGDWSGRANRRVVSPPEELKTWRPLLIDRDNLDQLMARLGVRLNVPLTEDGSQSLNITFNQLDDFHPDRLFDRLDIFESLRRLRGRLEHPQTFADAAAEVREWREFAGAGSETTPSDKIEPQKDVAAKKPLSDAGILDQILENSASRAPATKLSQPVEEASTEISELAKRAVKPYLTPDIEDDQEWMIGAVDARIAATMRSILHDSDFQALEAGWRGLDFLVSRLDTGTDLKIYLLDLSFAEFKNDLAVSDDVRSTALYKLLVEQTVGTAGGLPWAVIAGNYTFNLATDNQQLVERFAEIAQAAGAPLVAGATSHLLGCESLAATPDPDDWNLSLAPEIEEEWKRLTSTASADYIGFALPRFLLRLPYGKQTDPTEEFEFEELSSGDTAAERHESYLWGNPVFAVAHLLADGFTRNGWGFRPSDTLEIEGLPLHIYERQGETEIKPCAESLLTVRAATTIIEQGLMPLLSMKDSATVRLGMFQSISRRAPRARWGKSSLG